MNRWSGRLVGIAALLLVTLVSPAVARHPQPQADSGAVARTGQIEPQAGSWPTGGYPGPGMGNPNPSPADRRHEAEGG